MKRSLARDLGVAYVSVFGSSLSYGSANLRFLIPSPLPADPLHHFLSVLWFDQPGGGLSMKHLSFATHLGSHQWMALLHCRRLR